jgi:hypothetical protein
MTTHRRHNTPTGTLDGPGERTAVPAPGPKDA